MSIELSLKSIADSLSQLVELKKLTTPTQTSVSIAEEVSTIASNVIAQESQVPTAPVAAPSVEIPTAPTVDVPVPVAPSQPDMTQEELNVQLNEIAVALGGDGQPIFELLNKPPFNAKGIGDLKPEQYRQLVDAARKELL